MTNKQDTSLNKKLIWSLVAVIVIFCSIAPFVEKPKPPIHHKAYYLTVDEDGTVWIGDLPGQKQARYGECPHK